MVGQPSHGAAAPAADPRSRPPLAPAPPIAANAPKTAPQTGTGTPPPLLTGGADRWHVGTLTYTTAGLIMVFFWLLLGDFAFQMRERSAQSGVQMMMKIFGASSTYMSFVLAVIPSAVGLILGPIVSYRSDRYRSRWGRRIPFLIVTTPIVFVSMVGLSMAPMFGGWTHQALGPLSPGLNFCTLSHFAVFYTLFELACIASLVLFGALVNDVVPRPVMGRFYALFRVVSLGTGMAFNSFLLARLETHFFEIFLSISLVFGLGFAFMCLMVREGQYPPPTDDPEDLRAKGFVAAAKVYIRECFNLPYYRWVFAAMVLSGLTFMPFNTFAVPYAQSVEMSMQQYGDYVSMSFFVSLLLAYPLGWLVDRFHPLRVGMATLVLYMVASVYGITAVHDPRTFAVALVGHMILSGTYFTATAALGQMLFPKLKFGQFASAGGAIFSIGAITMGLVLGPALDLTGNQYRLTFAMSLALAIAGLIAFAVVYHQFMQLGGPKRYLPPEPTPMARD